MSLLGLAHRAGKVVLGEELVVREIQNGRAKLVILAKDASRNTSKKITDKCRYYQVPLRLAESRELLGHAVGKEARVAAALLEAGFAEKMAALLYD
jgi:ribosomal protein L7Ae-like RNA K-turn-binding protein